MKNRIRMTFALAFLCAALSTAMFASDNAYLYLVQGIPGRDYSASTDPSFPVDVLVNDEICYEHGLTFGTIAGPLTLAPGSYDVKVSVANSLAPCSNSPFTNGTVTLEAGKSLSAVVALDQSGNASPLVFTNDFTSVAQSMGRVLLAQAADAPAVQVVLQDTVTMKTYNYTVNPGALLDVMLPADPYTIEIEQGTTVLVASTPLTLFSQSATLLFAVGEGSNSTVTLQTKTVRDVI
jgi:hypothetical protein